MEEMSYFSKRPRFGKAHPYDIGRPLFWWKGHYDIHFLNKLYERTASEFTDFYNYYFEYYKRHNDTGDEREFYEHVCEIVDDGLRKLLANDERESKVRHYRVLKSKKQLRKFISFLKVIDKWNEGGSKDEIIAKQESELLDLVKKVAELKKELKLIKQRDTEDYINIPTGHLLTVADLMIKMQQQKTADNKELVFSIHSSVWVKMLCRYFRHDDEPISAETLRRYFPANRHDMGSKYAEVPTKYKLFDIVPAKKRS
ncbi:hypothetical protein [Sphingobacterium deserti]|nr:hypothetical protein [Sphingobacterium deserti]